MAVEWRSHPFPAPGGTVLPDEVPGDTNFEINPMWVRHQLCIASLEGVKNVEDVEHRLNSTLCILAAHYDGIGEEILNHYLDLVGIQYHDPVVERAVRDQVNVFHVTDLLRIYEPYSDPHWIDPENESAFTALLEDEMADFYQSTWEQSRKFRPAINEAVEEYVKTHI